MQQNYPAFPAINVKWFSRGYSKNSSKYSTKFSLTVKQDSIGKFCLAISEKKFRRSICILFHRTLSKCFSRFHQISIKSFINISSKMASAKILKNFLKYASCFLKGSRNYSIFFRIWIPVFMHSIKIYPLPTFGSKTNPLKNLFGISLNKIRNNLLNSYFRFRIHHRISELFCRNFWQNTPQKCFGCIEKWFL